ncbi:FCD domain-containing protein [Tropicimonas isoalkanivorans]|uniref:DNA-binding transcriptional regulator, FadR family n=1 Tax=Tropicimonas isoalkanivorans TaxID=441112 RepID=A0A1I1RHF4_9RHOB|nr:FCD domain-containing protein [Tropicimonas isoalkanivorans]SFD33746.1 DNA-binding transcriptional regulator, FadR family [Tropicimonas isoalkanivorans]
MTEFSASIRMPDMIAGKLISEIRDGLIAVGDALPPERELCARFDTSRPTIREALWLMQMRGFIEAGGGRRPRASLPSLQTILTSAADHMRDLLGDAESGAHLEQMRQFIETGAVREAAMRGDRVQIARLRDALDRNEAAIGTPRFAVTDIAFHREIVSIVGNPVILTLHDMFVSDLLAQRPPVDDVKHYDSNTFAEHREIYDAVLEGDVMAATEVMDRHLARSYRARLKKNRNPSTGHRNQH